MKRALIIMTGLIAMVGPANIRPALADSAVPGPAVRCRVELDREVIPAGQDQTVVIKVTLDTDAAPERSERPPVNLAVVLDRSGSMSGHKIERAKDAAIAALRRLSANDIFSLVIYDHNVETIVPAQSAANTEWIESRIRGIRPGGNTALFGGVSQGAAEIRKHLEGRYVHRMILLSDGLANTGPSSPADLGRLGASLLKEGISVTTVGVGTDYNEDLMARLAQRSDGNTYFVENSSDLARIFAAELGDVLSVVAKKVNVVIECPEGVVPVRIIGREGRIRNRNVELSLNQLYGGQEKYALVEVRIPEARAGESLELARARVEYENAVTQRRELSHARVSGTFSEDRDEVDASIQPAVQEAYYVNLNALAQEEAIDLADEGRGQEAAAKLKESSSMLKQVGRKLGLGSLLSKGDAVAAEAEEVEREGKMTRRGRKALRASAQQDKYQQLNQ